PGPAGTMTMSVLGSASFGYSTPIVRLQGRNGLDVNLTLYYNSHIWTIDAAGTSATLNADRDFPSYGFRLDFGYLEYDSVGNAYIFTGADGSKSHLSLTSGSSYDSDDSTYINYNSSTRVLTYKGGSRVAYEPFPGFPSDLFRPTQIQDTNGNSITIAYVSGK